MNDTTTTQRVMTALSRRVPLTLVVDLLDGDGPDSRRIFSRERADRAAAAVTGRERGSTAGHPAPAFRV